MPPEPLTKGLPPPDPRSLCPQLNLLNPPHEQNSWVRHWRQVFVRLLLLPAASMAGLAAGSSIGLANT